MSPARVAIADDDDKWRVLKFPDINFFSGTSFEKTIQSWMIPKLPVLYHITHGIVGCALCKLQSVGSNSPVRSFCSALRFHICFSLRLTLACTGHAVVPRSWSICQRGRGEIQRLFCHYQQTTCWFRGIEASGNCRVQLAAGQGKTWSTRCHFSAPGTHQRASAQKFKVANNAKVFLCCYSHAVLCTHEIEGWCTHRALITVGRMVSWFNKKKRTQQLHWVY